ncbi:MULTISPECIES: SDR family oxidoreductase [Ensifer]|uniref:SDR family oxidoreductase n=1 Tax=Ensifer adhaerens TaxID=106592 RepID=A0ABY8HH70_ENSAD|nr:MULTISPECIES: SDR family oxidoreductase [Ensifer]ANK71792.1 NAD(P)-dependent oxidoreductase [Ensifer adhaerens]KDP76058.1 NmrA family protein [Ensifer adhaerens]KQX04164.1 NAD(P)-dependent oxidoreductase [Ensifer sp. Root423]KQZ45723.1 NAD(P)-dependent oxidoreductase [Ensifer sp. Root558]MBD9538187.1 SDR family oxidoreductase [Ensifer sp. ENS04]
MAGKILVLGSNGTIGSKVVRALAARGETVRAASRKATAVDGAEAVAFDYEDATTFGPALDGVDRLFVLTPAGYLDPVGLVGPIMAAAAARGIKVVLMTVIGVDADDNIPYRQLELQLEKTGTPFVILRPNWFSDNFQSYWIEGIRHGAIAVPAAEGRTSFIDTRDIAESIVAALTSEAFNGRAFNLTGPEALSYGEAAAILSRVTVKPIAYTPVDDETFVGVLVGAGVPEDYAHFLASIFHPVREGWVANPTGDVKILTGHEPRSLETYAKDNAEALRA